MTAEVLVCQEQIMSAVNPFAGILLGPLQLRVRFQRGVDAVEHPSDRPLFGAVADRADMHVPAMYPVIGDHAAYKIELVFPRHVDTEIPVAERQMTWNRQELGP